MNDLVTTGQATVGVRILVGGSVFNGSEREFAILRFNKDGSSDATFGSDGVLTVSAGPVNE